MAGLVVQNTAGGASGSTRVLLRGNTEMAGNNQPLYVVDGEHGSERAGKTEMPIIIRNYSDDEATIIMVDSNIQREDYLAFKAVR